MGMGFYHVENSLYLGGGHLDEDYLSSFRKILPSGERIELQKLTTAKAGFAMAL